MNPSQKTLRLISIVIVVLLVGVGSWLWLSPFKQKTSEGITSGVDILPQPAEEPPVPVEVAPAFMGDLVMRLSVTGLTRAVREITIPW